MSSPARALGTRGDWLVPGARHASAHASPGITRQFDVRRRRSPRNRRDALSRAIYSWNRATPSRSPCAVASRVLRSVAAHHRATPLPLRAICNLWPAFRARCAARHRRAAPRGNFAQPCGEVRLSSRSLAFEPLSGRLKHGEGCGVCSQCASRGRSAQATVIVRRFISERRERTAGYGVPPSPFCLGTVQRIHDASSSAARSNCRHRARLRFRLHCATWRVLTPSPWRVSTAAPIP